MQESEFTGCANKVQGKDRNHVTILAFAGAALLRGPKKSCERLECQCKLERLFRNKNSSICLRVDPSGRFLYDELYWALSSAVRAFGLHPKGRPFKSDSAHHTRLLPERALIKYATLQNLTFATTTNDDITATHPSL